VVEARRHILAVLQDYPSLRPPIDHLCELLPRLQARYYSIASCPKVRGPGGSGGQARQGLRENHGPSAWKGAFQGHWKGGRGSVTGLGHLRWGPCPGCHSR
jgi:hypothetical protein